MREKLIRIKNVRTQETRIVPELTDLLLDEGWRMEKHMKYSKIDYISWLYNWLDEKDKQFNKEVYYEKH